MKTSARGAFAITAIALCFSPIASASTLVLKNGGRVTGEIVNGQDRAKKAYEIRTPSGATLTIAADQVAQVLDPNNALPQYEQWLTKMPATAAGNFKMAELCAGQELTEERLHHLRKVIELDPEHAEARKALGFKKTANGAWENSDDGWTAIGYKKVGPHFLSQQQIDLKNIEDATEDRKAKLRKEINSLNAKAKTPKYHEQALNEIRAIDDPIAIEIIVTNYLTTRPGAVQGNNLPDPELKKIYIGVVAKKLTPGIVNSLVHIVLNDPNPAIRDYTLQQLIEAKHPATSFVFLSQIREGVKAYNKDVVNRSAHALGLLNAQEAVFPLITVLTMKIRSQSGGNSQGGIGASPMFDQNGGAGISAGGKPTIIEEMHTNPDVLGALQRLTKQNFDYDQAAWKRWYVRTNTTNVGNLRRDE